ncbi:MAG: protein kinase [Acidobacteria bacterium]|nr:protein kinase [Acidobacteriota bacterium]
MPRPLLLIVDGEPLKTPGLVETLEQDGWEIRWLNAHEALSALGVGLVPDLMLLDTSRHAESSFDAAAAFRRANPRLPVLVIQDVKDPARPAPLPLQGILGRQDPVKTWPPALRPFKPAPRKEKLETEDIFGDILADLDEIPPPSRIPSGPIPAQVPSPRPPTAPIPVFKVAAPKVPSAPIPVVPPPPRVPTTPIPIAKPAPMPAPTAPAPRTSAAPVPTDRPASAPAPPAPRIPTAPIPVAHPASPSPLAAPTPPRVPTAPLPVFKMPAPKASSPAVPGAPKAASAPAPAPKPPVPPLQEAGRAPSPSRPLETEDIFGSVLADLDAVPASPPRKGKDEFTLSGIPGVADPFGAPVESRTASASTTAQAEGPSSIPTGGAFPAAGADSSGSGYEEFGNYYLLEKIAVGGMAELFKAKQRGVHNFQKIGAIKRILPHLSDNDEFVTMFIDEAKLAAQLTHPNIVQIFDLGKASGAYYIAMEFVDGKDLRSLLRRVREYQLPFPESVVAYVGVRLAQALDYAHRKRGMNDKELKLVHRDISPQNILLSNEGAVKLVDFGIAKAATKSTQTMAGALKGKLLYMSPEQALGQPLDARSDIYSLGLVLFELLTGERCFQADSELGVLEKVRLGRVADVKDFNPGVSEDMVTVLNKALARSVEQRYASARLMERDLRDLLARQGGEPTEHDVAEYVHALLRGTKEQVEQIMGLRFRAQGRPQPLPPPPQSSARILDDLPTAADIRKGKSPQISQVSLPQLDVGPQGRPRWVLPVVIFLAILIAGLIWIASTA